MKKAIVIGLDCAPPRILYDELIDELPVLGGLIRESKRYIMRSSHPPITIPAWMVMATGKTPGELGVYGFRHRRLGSYDEMYIANSRMIREEPIWNTIGKMGYHSIIVGFPPTYPPRPIKGYLISDFITPDHTKNYTWPPWLKKEIEELYGPYIFDVLFRISDRDRVKRELWRMTDQHFKVIKHLLKTKKWDFTWFVEIGTDRLHHAFWKYWDPEHPKHVPGNKYEDVIPEYYKLIDKHVGELLEMVPKDTLVFIVSDHGAKAMKGAFVINQWLIDNGYLALKRRPDERGADLKPNMIDWEHTRVWAWGGYYSRIFINIKGREPKGVVDPEDVPGLIEELKKEIKEIRGPSGEELKNLAYTPSELYPVVKGDPPDLMVYLDDLSWRPAGTLGWETYYLEENDKGPDDAVHDWYGVFSIHDPEGVDKPGDYGIINIHEIRDEMLKHILGNQ